MLYEAIIFALILGVATKGSIKNLAKLDLKLIPLVFIAFLLEYIADAMAAKGFIFSTAALILLELVVYSCLFVFLYFNRVQPGVKLMSLGMFLNFLVIIANQGAMPVSPENLDDAAINTLVERKVVTHSLLNEDTRFPWLADIFTQKFPAKAKISIGDVFISAGVFYLIWSTMHAKKRTAVIIPPTGVHP